jgi:hypothetical protein
MSGQHTLVKDIASVWREGRELIGIEMMLLRAELREARSSAASAAMMGVIAAVCALVMLGLAAAAGAAWLVAAGWPLHLALTAMTGLMLALTGIFILVARARWKSASVVPHKTIEQVKKDLDLVSTRLNA